MENFSENKSTTFPLPSSPHCAPNTTTFPMTQPRTLYRGTSGTRGTLRTRGTQGILGIRGTPELWRKDRAEKEYWATRNTTPTTDHQTPSTTHHQPPTTHHLHVTLTFYAAFRNF